ncbi:hypothetical protein MMG36_002371 [Salmonella enterica subsp. enterica serovar Newport]|nr:hypothetical protein [Salmonella enterica subsp. enterica serovar Newport]EEJ8782796.1 hypothetical protein [Salmonella enterica subsp. enterica]EEM6846006.1 hypothetical protein [Salmonella enterica subsp. enterica serovar Montevideo]EIY1731529.1 hypothetical protein [Salmonella enterica subsp. enterica serovar Newport]
MTKHQIFVRLVERHSNFRQFALNSGFNPRTVIQVVDRWAGSHDLPRGRLTYKILRDLSEAIDAEVIPGILRGK